MAEKGHRKKKAGRKATKRKEAQKDKEAAPGIDEGIKGPNPRAGQLHSKGRATASRARTAEKEQRRLHGEFPRGALEPCACARSEQPAQ